MNCFNHTNEVATAQCQDCQKGLCFRCSKEYIIPICSACNSNRIRNEKRKLYKELILPYLFGLILTYLVTNARNFNKNGNQGIMVYFGMFFVYSGIVSGWKFLDKNGFKMQFYFSINYFAYFIIKIIVSLIIGWLVLLYFTFVNISKLIKLYRIE